MLHFHSPILIIFVDMPDSERPEGIAQCSGVIKSRQNDKSVLRTVKGQRVLLPAEYCSCGICLLKDCYIVHEDLLIPFPFCISVNGKIKTVVIDSSDFMVEYSPSLEFL